MTTRRKVLITGASGNIGTWLRRQLRDQYDLSGVDCKAPADGDPSVRVANIRDREAMREACRGMDTVVHLAAHGGECDWATLLMPDNIDGTYQVVLAAVESGVRRFVFASTCHVTGGYGWGHPVTADMPVRPDSVYGVTKVFGEALLRWAVDEHGLTAVCLRIGAAFTPRRPVGPINQQVRAIWISQRDMAHLVACAIEADVEYEIVYGLSNNAERFWDIEHARRVLGYNPQDDGSVQFPPSDDVPGVDPRQLWPWPTKSRSKR